MSNDDPIPVRCLSWVQATGQVCGFAYSTSLLRFTNAKNRCDQCGGFEARRLDPPSTDTTTTTFQEQEP